MPTPIKIALDTNVLSKLLKDYGLEIRRRVKAGEWEVLLPVIVYAEAAVWKGGTVSAVVDALGARVIALEQIHADTLGSVWNNLRDHPRAGEKPEDLWKRHKCDWLIVGMAKREGWLLISDDNDYQRIKDEAGIQVMKLDEFVTRYLWESLR